MLQVCSWLNSERSPKGSQSGPRDFCTTTHLSAVRADNVDGMVPESWLFERYSNLPHQGCIKGVHVWMVVWELDAGWAYTHASSCGMQGVARDQRQLVVTCALPMDHTYRRLTSAPRPSGIGPVREFRLRVSTLWGVRGGAEWNGVDGFDASQQRYIYQCPTQ